MDPLIKLTRRSVELSQAAEKALCLRDPKEAYDYLDELYDLLTEEFVPMDITECESAESSNGS